MAETFTVLLSSAGRRVALLEIFRQALDQLGLLGRLLATDRSGLAAACHAADASFLVPAAHDAAFVPTMLELCERERVDLVIPTIDPELPVYAHARELFERSGTTVAISSAEVTTIGGDKVATHEWLRGHGFPTVRQSSVREVISEPDRWPWPLIVKPRFGSASIGVSVVRTLAALEAATADAEYVVQTIARGFECTVDVLADRSGRSVCAVPRRRLEVRSGEVSKAITERRPELQELARRICKELPGAYGALNIQMFVDPVGGTVSVIELNARFGGGFPLTWEAGGRFPRWIVEEILDLPSTASSTGWHEGLLMLRYDDAVFVANNPEPS